MIHFPPQENASASASTMAYVEHAVKFSPDFDSMEIVDTAPESSSSTSIEEELTGDQVELKLVSKDIVEKLDWNRKKVLREYIKLEQKFLAGKTDPDEQRRYKAMRRDRNSHIFADKYLLDYAESQRLQKLAEKLAEIQKYLRPITIG